MKTMENVVMHFGPREKICWWVPSGHPEGDSWLTIEQRCLSFRLGIELCHCGSTDSFGLDHSHIRMSDLPCNNRASVLDTEHRAASAQGSCQRS